MTKVIQNSTTANLDFFRKEFCVMNVLQWEDKLVYDMQNTKIAQQAEIRANKIIGKYELPFTAKASNFPLSTLIISVKEDAYLSAQSMINNICAPVKPTACNCFKNDYNSFERLTEMAGVEIRETLCHA